MGERWVVEAAEEEEEEEEVEGKREMWRGLFCLPMTPIQAMPGLPTSMTDTLTVPVRVSRCPDGALARSRT